jgi:hypothetical protein
MIRPVAALMASMALTASSGFAAVPSLIRVAIVPSAGQMSLVVELSDEARSVSTQQVSPTLLLIEAGPVAPPLRRQVLEAPSGLALVHRVSIDEGTTAAKEHVLRLSVTMKRAVPSTVRVVGRRLYIDFTVPEAQVAAAAPIAKVPIQPQQREPRLAGNGISNPVGTTAQEALTGATSRLEEIQPFLLSATSAPLPNPVVLNAVADAISSVQQSLRGMGAAGHQVPSFELLVSSASMAAEAVSADFHGDRASKAKQSIAVLAAAKTQLNH